VREEPLSSSFSLDQAIAPFSSMRTAGVGRSGIER
jgi:hypothetical protein